MIKLGFAVIALACLSSCASSSEREPSVHAAYLSMGALDSELLVLHEDCTFSLWFRTHLTIEERERGTWVLEAPGELSLIGPWRRMVIQGPIAVGGFHHPPPTLRDIRAELAKLLSADPKKAMFDSGELQALATRNKKATTRDGLTLEWSVVPIIPLTEEITRDQVGALLEAIDRYPGPVPADVVHASILRTGDRDFLHWKDGGPGWVEASVERIREAVEAGETSVDFAGIFIRLSSSELDRTMSEGHPFRSRR